MRKGPENAGFTPLEPLRLRFNPDTPSTAPKSPAFAQLARGPNAPLLAKSQQNANVAILTLKSPDIPASRYRAVTDCQSCSPSYKIESPFRDSQYDPIEPRPSSACKPARANAAYLPGLMARKFITKATIESFSSGRLSAIITVIATRVLSSIALQSPKNSALLRSKKYRNIVAAIRLLPSKKL